MRRGGIEDGEGLNFLCEAAGIGREPFPNSLRKILTPIKEMAERKEIVIKKLMKPFGWKREGAPSIEMTLGKQRGGNEGNLKGRGLRIADANWVRMEKKAQNWPPSKVGPSGCSRGYPRSARREKKKTKGWREGAKPTRVSTRRGANKPYPCRNSNPSENGNGF